MLVIYLKKEIGDETRYSILFSYRKTLVEKGIVARYIKIYEVPKRIYKKLSTGFLAKIPLHPENLTFLDFSDKQEDVVLATGEDPKTITNYYTTNAPERITFML